MTSGVNGVELEVEGWGWGWGGVSTVWRCKVDHYFEGQISFVSLSNVHLSIIVSRVRMFGCVCRRRQGGRIF